MPRLLWWFLVASVCSILAVFVVGVILLCKVTIERQLADAYALQTRLAVANQTLSEYTRKVATFVVSVDTPDLLSKRIMAPIHGPRFDVPVTAWTHGFTMLSASHELIPEEKVAIAWRAALAEAVEWPGAAVKVNTAVVMDDGSFGMIIRAANDSWAPSDLETLSSLAVRIRALQASTPSGDVYGLSGHVLAPHVPQDAAYYSHRIVGGPASQEIGTVIVIIDSDSFRQLANLSPVIGAWVSIYTTDGTVLHEGSQMQGLRPVIDRPTMTGLESLSDYRITKGMLLLSTQLGALQIVSGVPLTRLLFDMRFSLLGAVATLLLALAAILFVYERFKRHVVMPAATQMRLLEESEAFIAEMLSAAPAGLIVARASDGTVVTANRLAEELLQRPLVDGSGRLLREALVDCIPRAGQTAEVEIAEAETELRSRYLLLSSSATRYQGEPALLCSLTDITAPKRVETVVRDSAAAAQRAREEADAANVAKTIFLSTMSHEIRTPLYGMLGSLELIERTGLPDAQKRRLNTAHTSARALLEVIDSVLDFAKIEAGESTLRPKPIDIVALVESIVAGYALLAQKKGLSMQCVLYPAARVQIMADGARVRQIASNLISNAIKFTDVGRVFVRLDLRRDDDVAGEDRMHVRLQVADSGIGIAPADQKRLFDPFKQAEDLAEDRRLHSTGLGLPISQRLAAMMNGSIDVVSTLGLGSSFTFEADFAVVDVELAEKTLAGGSVVVRAVNSDVRENLLALVRSRGAAALAEGDPVPPDVETAHAVLLISDDDVPRDGDDTYAGIVQLNGDPLFEGGHHYSADPYSHDSIVGAVQRAMGRESGAPRTEIARPMQALELKVIVVEDHPVNRDLMLEQLAEIGCQAIAFKDAESMLAYAHMADADVIIADMNLPGMDGSRLAEHLRSAGIGVPVVGVSANAVIGDIERATAAGMRAYLVKPVLLAQLYDVLAPFADPHRLLAGAGPAKPVERNRAERQRLFVVTLADDFRSLVDACSGNDFSLMADVAHRMKSGFLAMNLAIGAQRCDAIQAAAWAHDRVAVGSAVAALREHVQPLIEELQ